MRWLDEASFILLSEQDAASRLQIQTPQQQFQSHNNTVLFNENSTNNTSQPFPNASDGYRKQLELLASLLLLYI